MSRFAVGGDRWAGTLSALGEVWQAPLPPVLKLLAIFYADAPGTTKKAAEWTGLDPDEAQALTDVLLDRGVIGPYVLEIRTSVGVSWERVRVAVFDRDGRVCRHCGTTEDLTIDHIIPRSFGGSDDMDNLQVLCRPCNSRKGVTIS